MLDQPFLRSGRDSARSARPVLNVTRASSPSSGCPVGKLGSGRGRRQAYRTDQQTKEKKVRQVQAR